MQRKTELYVVGGVLLVIIIFAVIAGIFFNATPQTQTPPVPDTTVPPISSTDQVRGAPKAPVSLIEYGDFQCPACGAYEPMVEQLTKQYGSKVAFVFRNFPLPQHQDAQIAAQAAEAAGLQGKYWDMHDLLYQKQNDWSNEPASSVVAKYFDGYARSLGLNVQKFDADINAAAVKEKVQKDIASGTAAEIDHTPTFFVNLHQIANPSSVQEFEHVLDAALASSTAAK